MTTSESTPCDSPAGGGGQFSPTRWTLVLRARGASEESRVALSELCGAYYAPVLTFLRREGRDEDGARELAQGFFSQLLATPHLDGVEPGRGRFRSYLLGAVKHFLGEQRQRAAALKRGGGEAPLSLDASTNADTTGALQVLDPAASVPDTWFDRQWATAVVNQAVSALGSEAEAEGKSWQFSVLKPWLLGEVPALSQAEAALRLGLSDGAVKVAIHRLRKRFREVIKAQIAQTVDDPAQVQEELRYLVDVLVQSSPVPGRSRSAEQTVTQL